MKYFEVIAKCGHVVRQKFFEGHFYVNTEDAKNAAIIIMSAPRVKKDHADCILSVNEISYEDYKNGCIEMNNNPYFKCKTKKEQKAFILDLDSLIKDETERQNNYRKSKNKYYKSFYEKENTKIKVFEGKQQLRNPNKYYRMNTYKLPEYKGA